MKINLPDIAINLHGTGLYRQVFDENKRVFEFDARDYVEFANSLGLNAMLLYGTEFTGNDDDNDDGHNHSVPVWFETHSPYGGGTWGWKQKDSEGYADYQTGILRRMQPTDPWNDCYPTDCEATLVIIGPFDAVYTLLTDQAETLKARDLDGFLGIAYAVFGSSDHGGDFLWCPRFMDNTDFRSSASTSVIWKWLSYALFILVLWIYWKFK